LEVLFTSAIIVVKFVAALAYVGDPQRKMVGLLRMANAKRVKKESTQK